MKLLALTIDFCIIAAVWVSSGRAKEPGAVKADRNGLALVSGQPCRDRLT